MLNRTTLHAAVAVLAIFFSAAVCNRALAAFADGEFVTYWQTSWGEPATAAGQVLSANYGTVYASTGGVLDLGLPGSSMTFTAASHVLAYLPAAGSSGTLTGIDNPTSTTSGSFGGDVLALRLNVDFADHGFTGTSVVPFGDLRLIGFATLPLLNDMSVREFLTNVNSHLGNGPGVYDIGLLASPSVFHATSHVDISESSRPSPVQ